MKKEIISETPTRCTECGRKLPPPDMVVRNERIVRMRTRRGWTYAQIAKKNGLTPEGVRRILLKSRKEN